MKTCTKCGVTKSVTEFNKDSQKRDGLRCWCRACGKEWREANADMVKAYDVARMANNPDKERARWAKYRAENKAKIIAGDAKRRKANREKRKATAAAWHVANPEARRIYENNRRAIKRESGGKLSRGLSAKLFKLQRGKCACGCKQPLGNDYHLDHRMPLALGGANEDWNMQLLRATCNQQKHAKHPIDFMQQRGFLL